MVKIIKIIGAVDFLISNEPDDSYNLNLKDIRLQVLKSENIVSPSGKPGHKITCKFEIFLQEDPVCKSKNDYVGKIKPFLESFLPSALILNTQSYNISRIDGSIRHITEFF